MGAIKLIDTAWEKSVKQCSVILAERFEAKLKIASIAIKCCYRSDGTPRPREYSLVRFSSEIGMKHSTLKEWVNLKRTVWDKLSKKHQNPETFSIHQARAIRSIAGPQASKLEVNGLYAKITQKGNQYLKYRSYINGLESLKYNTLEDVKISKATEGQLLEIQSLCSEIKENITKFRRRKK